MSRTAQAAQGKWKGVLLQLGAPAQALAGKHGPCPFCGGKDRYRWDNKEGTGSFFCSQCGSGNGFEFLMRLKGWDFATAAREVDAIVGNVRPEPVKRQRPPQDTRRLLRDLWESARKVTLGDPVSLYLQHRRLPSPQNTDVLRFHPECPVPNSPGARMAMLARVAGPDGKGATIHRTFLTPQGRKADMDCPRAIMPGEIPAGAAIRLAMHGERLGIAEGIETALAATERFKVPVWAALNATMMTKWIVPEGVKEVLVFGDNDAKFGGAAAAYALAHRLAARAGLAVQVHIPERIGADWADAACAALVRQPRPRPDPLALRHLHTGPLPQWSGQSKHQDDRTSPTLEAMARGSA